MHCHVNKPELLLAFNYIIFAAACCGQVVVLSVYLVNLYEARAVGEIFLYGTKVPPPQYVCVSPPPHDELYSDAGARFATHATIHFKSVAINRSARVH